jgi:hypothetical protein
MKALTLLSQAVKLRNVLPEPKGSAIGEMAIPVRSSGTSKAAFVSNPTAFTRLKSSLERYCDQLPASHRPPWKRWDEGTERLQPRIRTGKDTAVLVRLHTQERLTWQNFLIGNAYMQLWNVNSLAAENSEAVLVARRIVDFVCTYSGLDVSETLARPVFDSFALQMTGGYDTFIITV